ncbi:phosphoribosylanthranilate isomerase [Halomarina halobia]|uniref:N-(5'-phosphoribosyl)anthranilate isomerase n=1 Tax=Halomarina halobia TaxID=3033386 RepID=A0ABD6A8G1_9EURY|nr:phosphoribosylanthranilate isomerase [Halomarina sp. PSR21]
MTRVKLCGITTPGDRDAAVAAGADAVGVISDVSVDTHREVAPEAAAELVAGTPGTVTSTLVTMPDSPEAAAELVGRVRPDEVQVHGMSAEGVAALARAVDVPVVAAVGADDPDATAYARAASALLVDTPSADGGGGTGETHDWTRTRAVVESVDAPVVLAGGLTPENVAEAVETVRPFGVDAASGVERPNGEKDRAAMRTFVAAVRGA